MKIDIAEFREAYEVVNRIDSHTGILSSQYVKMVSKGGTLGLSLTGLAFAHAEMPVADARATWTFYADRRMLGTFLATARGDQLEMEVEKDQLRLRSGRQRAVLAAMETIPGYQIWKPAAGGKSVKLTSNLREDLGILASYAPVTAAADHLSAVYLVKGYGVLSSDQFVIAGCIDATISETYPLPVVFSMLVRDLKIKQLVVEKQGAGARNGKGYLYQTTSSRLKDYPMKSLREVLDKGVAAKTLFSVSTKRLNEALDYLRGFVFGSDTDVLLEVKVKPDDKLMDLSLKSSQGPVHRKIPPLTVKEEIDIKLPVAKVYPWVQHILTLNDAPMEYIQIHKQDKSGDSYKIQGLRTKIAKRQYLLLVAEG